ncbi:hypothetical protein ACFFHH_25915 [Cytobacillus solani]|uniref:RNA polymerase subunit sigma n=1 Tax=Cytobacillus solani TaxID=1637975 RepID=A0A0Q3VGX7_9BACI|nr:hypothetical protein [Cytobacillus solani]KOP82159.1 hypothetical protein AMS60_06430 [Bacillus sp. FJAT-21945]KQL19138.1 hypothetical protein AN957_11465 [Cytobacillus solani]
MSLKSVEMQIALPRTIEAGKIQEQLQQRGQNMNDIGVQQTQKEEEKKRSTVIKQEQKGNVKLSQKQQENQQGTNGQQENEEQKEEKEKKQKEYHPYKGTLIDFSG